MSGPAIRIGWLLVIGLALVLTAAGPAQAQSDLPIHDIAADSLLVGVAPELVAVEAAEQLRAQGLTVERYWPELHLAQVRLPTEDALVSAAARDALERERTALEAQSFVRYAAYDGRVYAASLDVAPTEPKGVAQGAGTPNDPLLAQQWALAKLGVFDAWEISQGSDQIAVAILDSGYDLAHEDIDEDSLWTNEAELAGEPGVDDDVNGFIDDRHGWDWIENDDTPNDPFGHGTHVGGTMAATTNNGAGVAGLGRQVRVMPLRVLDSQGTGQVSDLIDALMYAWRKGARVANLSLVIRFDSQALHEAIQLASAHNLMVVAAAGNAGSGVLWPAAYAEAMAVAATDEADIRPEFSSFGPEIDLAAPGVNILSTAGADGYLAQSGTSMATAHVSILAALVMSLRPDLPVDEVTAVLRSAADDVNADHAPGADVYLGAGRINMQRAMAQAAVGVVLSVDQAETLYAFVGEAILTTVKLSTPQGEGAAAGPGLPVSGAVVHYRVTSEAEPSVPWSEGRLLTDAQGLATLAFLAPEEVGDYRVEVHFGEHSLEMPLRVRTRPYSLTLHLAADTVLAQSHGVSLHVEMRNAEGNLATEELPLRLVVRGGALGNHSADLQVTVATGVFDDVFQPGPVAGTALITAAVGSLVQQRAVTILPDAAAAIEGPSTAAPFVLGADGGEILLTFRVYDQFGNPVVDGTPVEIVSSAGVLSAGVAFTAAGEATTTLTVHPEETSPVEVIASALGTPAQTRTMLRIARQVLWLPVVVSR